MTRRELSAVPIALWLALIGLILIDLSMGFKNHSLRREIETLKRQAIERGFMETDGRWRHYPWGNK